MAIREARAARALAAALLVGSVAARRAAAAAPVIPTIMGATYLQAAWTAWVTLIIAAFCAVSAASAAAPDGTVRRVLLVIAMEGEAAPAAERLGLKKATGALPASVKAAVFSGAYAGGEVTLVVSGKQDTAKGPVDQVGTVPAALHTYLAIEAFKPDVVVNAGTCGGFKAKGCAIGDKFVATKFINHDRRIAIPGTGFEEYGVDEREALRTPSLVAALGYKTGVVSTGNSLDCSDADRKLLVASGASCKEMEASAIAYACALQNVPLVALKVITDIVDGPHPAHEEFMANLGAAAKSLQAGIPAILTKIMGEKIGRL